MIDKDVKIDYLLDIYLKNAMLFKIFTIAVSAIMLNVILNLDFLDFFVKGAECMFVFSIILQIFSFFLGYEVADNELDGNTKTARNFNKWAKRISMVSFILMTGGLLSMLLSYLI